MVRRKAFSYETSCAGKKVTLYIYRRKNGTGEWYLCCIHLGNLKELKDVQHLAKTKKYVSQVTSL